VKCTRAGGQRIKLGIHESNASFQLLVDKGHTFDEIAAKLGLTRGNVKHHYFRGLDKLRKELFGSKLPGKRAI